MNQLDQLFEEFEQQTKQDVIFKPTNEAGFDRAVYLLYEMKITLPNWIRLKFPFAEDLLKPRSLWSPLLKSSYVKGEKFGKGEIEELKQCLDIIITPELKDYKERSNFWNWLASLSGGLFENNYEKPLEEIDPGKEIPKFSSNWFPIDYVTGGLYQSIITVAGTPGAGKTSIVLSIFGELAKQYPVWYFQTEIPKDLILARINQIKPTNLVKGSLVCCGNYNSETILQKVQKDPDPNRIIIYDSPEIMPGSIDKIQYFDKTFQDLIRLKQLCKCVIVTSQIKQKLSWDMLDEYSLSDSAFKARASDVILYLGRAGDNLLIKTGKNRFGVLRNYMLNYDYANLSIGKDDFDGLYTFDTESTEDQEALNDSNNPFV